MKEMSEEGSDEEMEEESKNTVSEWVVINLFNFFSLGSGMPASIANELNSLSLGQ